MKEIFFSKLKREVELEWKKVDNFVYFLPFDELEGKSILCYAYNNPGRDYGRNIYSDNRINLLFEEYIKEVSELPEFIEEFKRANVPENKILLETECYIWEASTPPETQAYKNMRNIIDSYDIICDMTYPWWKI